VFTPASEVDGREKMVDNFVAQQKGVPAPSMVTGANTSSTTTTATASASGCV
jgi:hypothetical protein